LILNDGDQSRIADYLLNDKIRDAEIKYTLDPILYKTERHSDESFTIHLPIEISGEYVLILKFCEVIQFNIIN